MLLFKLGKDRPGKSAPIAPAEPLPSGNEPAIIDPNKLNYYYEEIITHPRHSLIMVFTSNDPIDEDHKIQEEKGFRKKDAESKCCVRFLLTNTDTITSYLTFYTVDGRTRTPICRIRARTTKNFSGQHYVLKTINMSDPFGKWNTFELCKFECGYWTENVNGRITVLVGERIKDSRPSKTDNIIQDHLTGVAGSYVNPIFVADEPILKKARLELVDIYESCQLGKILYPIESFEADVQRYISELDGNSL